jgi:pyrroline-5-carboxylate reductase
MKKINLGFIGTGKIASSVITGISASKISYAKIFISPRNKKIANNLKKKIKKVIIAKNNQEIVNNCNWVFLSITPIVGEKIIKELKFNSNQTIVSFISTIKLVQLKKAIKVKAKIVRAIPLPPISFKKGPVPICPPDKKVKEFFNKIGTTVEIKNEESSINFWSTSGMMASFYQLLKVMTDWLVKKGVKRSNAQKYITTLFLALSEDAVANSKKDLKYLVKESQTPSGLNEQAIRELTRSGFYLKLEKALSNLHKRLNK